MLIMNTAEAERKTKPLKIRLTPAEYAKLEALAASEGVTLGAWVSCQIAARRAPRMDRREVRAELKAARRLAAGDHS